jgi:hypothetical protein
LLSTTQINDCRCGPQRRKVIPVVAHNADHIKSFLLIF